VIPSYDGLYYYIYELIIKIDQFRKNYLYLLGKKVERSNMDLAEKIQHLMLVFSAVKKNYF